MHEHCNSDQLAYCYSQCNFHTECYNLSSLYGLQESVRLTVSNVRNMKMNNEVVVVAVSPDSKHIAVAQLDSTVKVRFDFSFNLVRLETLCLLICTCLYLCLSCIMLFLCLYIFVSIHFDSHVKSCQ